MFEFQLLRYVTEKASVVSLICSSESAIGISTSNKPTHKLWICYSWWQRGKGYYHHTRRYIKEHMHLRLTSNTNTDVGNENWNEICRASDAHFLITLLISTLYNSKHFANYPRESFQLQVKLWCYF